MTRRISFVTGDGSCRQVPAPEPPLTLAQVKAILDNLTTKPYANWTLDEAKQGVLLALTVLLAQADVD